MVNVYNCSKCAICLEDFDNKLKIKTLSCGHQLHNHCFFNIVMRQNLFIDCPLCRRKNICLIKSSKIPRENILQFVSNTNKNKKKLKRCICITNQGKWCKNAGSLLNYGMCRLHNPEVLTEDFQIVLMEKYLYLILAQRNSWYSKIFLIDLEILK